MAGFGRVAALVALLLATGCTSAPPLERELRSMGGCGPVTYDDVRGQRPTYGPDRLTYFDNAQDMCAGRWVPGADAWLVPQGMTIADGTAYVAGFDGTQKGRHRLCTMQSMDLETGDVIRTRYPVRGQVGPRRPTECRHGGGVVADEHGVWLAETQRLWLLDPTTLKPLRGWALTEPVRGSFAVLDDDGRLGTRGDQPGDSFYYVVMNDPEGNEFCVS